jgi:NAD(P)-dependent dehydrogenase (short-subunit alcohol dehydrogenase family)
MFLRTRRTLVLSGNDPPSLRNKQENFSMSKVLTEKVALVTGASSGIGRGVATCLIEAGAQVYGTARNADKLKATAAELGCAFVAVRADSNEEADLDGLHNRIRNEAGRIDIVVANSGFSEPCTLSGMTGSHIDRILGNNLRATMLTTHKMLPLLSDGGSIVLISSTMAFRGFAGISAYSAAKAGIRALARSWLVELKDKKARVNVISPGPIETEGMWAMGSNEEATRAFIAQLTATVPLARLGSPRDVGNAVVFLSSAAAGFINGADIQIDGGTSQI